jgi:hypothetical protein
MQKKLKKNLRNLGGVEKISKLQRVMRNLPPICVGGVIFVVFMGSVLLQDCPYELARLFFRVKTVVEEDPLVRGLMTNLPNIDAQTTPVKPTSLFTTKNVIGVLAAVVVFILIGCMLDDNSATIIEAGVSNSAVNDTAATAAVQALASEARLSDVSSTSSEGPSEFPIRFLGL